MTEVADRRQTIYDIIENMGECAGMAHISVTISTLNALQDHDPE
jgi:hypothetical protein